MNIKKPFTQCLALTITLLCPILAKAENDLCDFKSYYRFLQVEKTGHKVVNPKPDPTLERRMEMYEINCPFQVEADFNSDGKEDWAGIVRKGEQYSLLLYISHPKQYQVVSLKDYPYMPERTHFSLINTNQLKHIAGDETWGKLSKTSLVLNQISKPAQIYAWNGKEMAYVTSFEGQFSQPPAESQDNNPINHHDKPDNPTKKSW